MLQKYGTKILVILAFSLTMTSCSGKESGMTRFQLDADTGGVMERVNNIYNTVVVSNDPNVYKAEYEAGFVQGRLQKEQLIPMRDNTWDSAYLTNPNHTFPKQIPPTADEIAMAQRTLKMNWEYTVEYIRREGDSDVGLKLRRLMYRMIGIYHGAVRERPESLQFDTAWFPTFTTAEMALGYESPQLTFMDIYFINAFGDLFDLLPDNAPPSPTEKAAAPSKCSAFVKKSGDDIYITHNSWYSFLDQSQAFSLWVNGDYMTMNVIGPGAIGSGTDFGYTNKGIMFNETTHRATYSEPKTKALWMFWRATLAEQFAASIDDFFRYVSLEPSGTYMNGYMVVDAKSNEIGMVEMSYQSFVFYKPDGQGGTAVSTKPAGLSTVYDRQLIQPDYLLGINFPASQLIIDEIKAKDNRPSRRTQFNAKIGSISDIESAKALITYTDPANPLSIYGRWDLGYGDTPYPKTIPDGSIDAKAASASMARGAMKLEGVLDTGSSRKSFWMKYGTPAVNGKPFIWSESAWKGTKLRSVPDRVDGEYTLLNAYIR
jgi:hypothetical protein